MATGIGGGGGGGSDGHVVVVDGGGCGGGNGGGGQGGNVLAQALQPWRFDLAWFHCLWVQVFWLMHKRHSHFCRVPMATECSEARDKRGVRPEVAQKVAQTEPTGAEPRSDNDHNSHSEDKPAILAQRALATSRGRMRVSLEQLGPAVFNRQGNITDSTHCRALLTRILEEEGFATFRYDAGYCHEANPADPMMITRHANEMNTLDTALPRPTQEQLKGVFAKTHLVTALQMYKAGQMPELARYVEARSQGQPKEFEEFLQALKFGLYMHVFPWYAVHKHPESFRALMAADNFNHGVGLKDSEMRCVYAMSEARGQMDTGAEPREAKGV